MRVRRLGLWSLLACVLLCACGGDDSSGTEFTTELLSVKDREVVIGAETESYFVAVEANCQWSATLTEKWDGMTVNPTTGGATVTTPKNTTPTRRHAVLRITSASGKVVRSVNFYQDGAASTISVSPEALQFTSSRGTQQIRITSNTKWIITVSDNVNCSVSPSSGEGNADVTVTVEENTSETVRPTILLTISANDGSSVQRIVRVNQDAAAKLYVSGAAEVTIEATDRTATFGIDGTATAEWHLTIYSGSDWVRLPASATYTGKGTFTVSCDNNERAESREAEIRVQWSGADIVMKLVQKAATVPSVSLSIDETTIDRHAATLSYVLGSSMYEVTESGLCYTLP